MKIIANGFPKSGCHAITKGIELLGIPRASEPGAEGVALCHFPYSSLHSLPKDVKIINILRNPRNCLISMVRFLAKPLATGMIVKTLRDYYSNQPFKQTLEDFLPWEKPSQMLGEDDSWLDVPFPIRYEKFVENDMVLRQVAEYIGTPFYEDAFTNLPGLTVTWNDKHSNWEEVWNDDIEKVWVGEGLDLLEQAMGYNNQWKSPSP